MARYEEVKIHGGTTVRPRRARSAETLSKSSTIGATDGSIIAAIIVTQTPRYQPSPPRSVPGPVSIPRIRCTVTIQVASAAASTTVLTTNGLRLRNQAWRSVLIAVGWTRLVRPVDRRVVGVLPGVVPA